MQPNYWTFHASAYCNACAETLNLDGKRDPEGNESSPVFFAECDYTPSCDNCNIPLECTLTGDGEKPLKTATIGPVSSGTLRQEDLIEAFVDELQSLDRPDFDADSYLDIDPDKDPDSASWAIDELTEMLQEHAPEYVYFGTAEGDGAEFGFWVENDFLETMRMNDVQIVDDLADAEPGEIAIVNDHGNVTFGYLYGNGEFREAWAIV